MQHGWGRQWRGSEAIPPEVASRVGLAMVTRAGEAGAGKGLGWVQGWQ